MAAIVKFWQDSEVTGPNLLWADTQHLVKGYWAKPEYVVLEQQSPTPKMEAVTNTRRRRHYHENPKFHTIKISLQSNFLTDINVSDNKNCLPEQVSATVLHP